MENYGLVGGVVDSFVFGCFFFGVGCIRSVIRYL